MMLEYLKILLYFGAAVVPFSIASLFTTRISRTNKLIYWSIVSIIYLLSAVIILGFFIEIKFIVILVISNFISVFSIMWFAYPNLKIMSCKITANFISYLLQIQDNKENSQISYSYKNSKYFKLKITYNRLNENFVRWAFIGFNSLRVKKIFKKKENPDFIILQLSVKGDRESGGETFGITLKDIYDVEARIKPNKLIKSAEIVGASNNDKLVVTNDWRKINIPLYNFSNYSDIDNSRIKFFSIYHEIEHLESFKKEYEKFIENNTYSQIFYFRDIKLILIK